MRYATVGKIQPNAHMTSTSHQHSLARYRSLPKVDLHRHLEGSIRLQTLIEISKKHGIELKSEENLLSLVQIDENEPYSFDIFLKKFTTLRTFYKSPEFISRITREAIEDAAKDNIKYLELRFTPVALSITEGFPLKDVTDWVIDSAKEAARENKITVRLIASFNRHESHDLSRQVIELAMERVNKGIVGLDVAGNEAEYPTIPFAGLLHEAKQEGLKITIHAGEWGSPQNIIDAISTFEADRIGHGVHILEDSYAIALARERQTPFEVCVTSNYKTGAIPLQSEHPLLQMLAKGINATINTDDPSVLGIDLSHEYQYICENMGISFEELLDRIKAAIHAAFLSKQEKETLLKEITPHLQAHS